MPLRFVILYNPPSDLEPPAVSRAQGRVYQSHSQINVRAELIKQLQLICGRESAMRQQQHTRRLRCVAYTGESGAQRRAMHTPRWPIAVANVLNYVCFAIAAPPRELNGQAPCVHHAPCPARLARRPVGAAAAATHPARAARRHNSSLQNQIQDQVLYLGASQSACAARGTRAPAAVRRVPSLAPIWTYATDACIPCPAAEMKHTHACAECAVGARQSPNAPCRQPLHVCWYHSSISRIRLGQQGGTI